MMQEKPGREEQVTDKALNEDKLQAIVMAAVRAVVEAEEQKRYELEERSARLDRSVYRYRWDKKVFEQPPPKKGVFGYVRSLFTEEEQSSGEPLPGGIIVFAGAEEPGQLHTHPTTAFQLKPLPSEEYDVDVVLSRALSYVRLGREALNETRESLSRIRAGAEEISGAYKEAAEAR